MIHGLDDGLPRHHARAMRPRIGIAVGARVGESAIDRFRACRRSIHICSNSRHVRLLSFPVDSRIHARFAVKGGDTIIPVSQRIPAPSVRGWQTLALFIQRLSGALCSSTSGVSPTRQQCTADCAGRGAARRCRAVRPGLGQPAGDCDPRTDGFRSDFRPAIGMSVCTDALCSHQSALWAGCTPGNVHIRARMPP